jgi:penicillin-binding protein 2
MRIAGHTFKCDNGEGHHGVLALRQAIAKSCDIYFWNTGEITGVDLIAAEARRFHLDQPAGIELPGETRHMLIPDPEWKQRNRDEEWFQGDTANMAIGQGFVLVTPLDMACFAASLARGETVTKPTLIHDPNHPQQHSEPIGLSPAQYAAVIDGMKGCVTKGGTAGLLELPAFAIPGVQIAGKTGTAQVRKESGTVDMAWFIGFAPADHPQVAWAVVIEGDTLNEGFGGAQYAAPVAAAVLKKYFEKQNRSPEPKALTSN